MTLKFDPIKNRFIDEELGIEPGSKIFYGEGEPNESIGSPGDFYIETESWEIYQKAELGWGDGTSLIGRPGENGIDGAPGVDGRDGKDGVDGTDGKDGVDGTDGLDGVNGRNGVDGKSVELRGVKNVIEWRRDGEDWQYLYTMPVQSIGGGGGTRKVGELRDTKLTNLTVDQILKYDGINWVNADQVSLAGYVPYVGATQNVNLATYRIITHGVQADATDGLYLYAANGTTQIGNLGAANTANVTWYGAHNFNTATQDTIAAFVGAGKTLSSLSTSTYPSLTELSYVKGVTSAIQTQLSGKVPYTGATANVNLGAYSLTAQGLITTNEYITTSGGAQDSVIIGNFARTIASNLSSFWLGRSPGANVTGTNNFIVGINNAISLASASSWVALGNGICGAVNSSTDGGVVIGINSDVMSDVGLVTSIGNLTLVGEAGVTIGDSSKGSPYGVSVGFLAGHNLTSSSLGNVLIGPYAGNALTSEQNKLYISNSLRDLITGDFSAGWVYLNGDIYTNILPSKAVVTDADSKLVDIAYQAFGGSPIGGTSNLVARDFTGATAFNNYVPNLLSTATAAGTTTMSRSSARVQVATGSTTQNYTLPDARDLEKGWQFEFLNRSTGTITIKDGSGATLTTLPGSAALTVTCLNNTTLAGSWDFSSLGVVSVSGTTNRISVTTTSGAAVVDIASNYIGQNTITTLGTITTGVWNGTAINLSSYATGTLQAAQFPALTGDVTTTAGSLATTLATVNANVGSFGSSTAIPSFTVNAKGLITAVSTNAVIAPAGTLTGTTLASNVVSSSLTSVSTISSGTWNASIIGLAYGGTNANLVASNGGIVWSNASQLQILAGTATANKMLLSGSSATPTWSTSTIPSSSGTAGKILRSDGTDYALSTATFADTYTESNLLYSNGSNAVVGLATANNGVLITSGTGVPSISSTLPNAVQDTITRLGTVTTGTWNATAIAANYGGTGNTSYTIGDILYASGATTLSKLAGVATGNALISGGVGTAPSWGKIGLTTHISGTLGVGNGGTGTSTTFTQGSVVIAGASGVYTQDNTGLFFSTSSDYLGLGTASPTSPLHIATTASGVSGLRAAIRLTGNINTSGVEGSSHSMAGVYVANVCNATGVNGWFSGVHVALTNSSTRLDAGIPRIAGLRVEAGTYSANFPPTYCFGIHVTAPTMGASSNAAIFATNLSIGYETNTPPTNGAIFSGNVGIGKTSASTPLDVNGTITATGIASGTQYYGRCELFTTTSQTLANATWVDLTFASADEIYDPLGWHDTVSNTQRVTVNATGIYRVIATIRFVDTTGGFGGRLIRLQKNGSTDLSSACHGRDDLGRASATLYWVGSLNSGDYLIVGAYQNCGGTLGTNHKGFSVERIS